MKTDWFEGLHIHRDRGSLLVEICFPYWKRPTRVVAYDDSIQRV